MADPIPPESGPAESSSAELKRQLSDLTTKLSDISSPSKGTDGDKSGDILVEMTHRMDLTHDLGWGVLIFSIFLFGLIAALIFSGKVKVPENDGQWLVRVIVVPLAILGAIFLVVVGYSEDQMSPAVGLLGTIIAYLLGSSTRPAGTPAPAPAPAPPPAPPPAPVDS
jgi:hypothetical protein